MTILITGSTGTIGMQVLTFLEGQNAEISALTRTPEKAQFPAGVTAVQGDLSDVDSVRAAGVKGIVYLSVFKGEAYADVPHFASKVAVERMIHAAGLPVTILRSAYFIQNDLRQKDALLGGGVYGMPIGDKGISMVDIRDIGEAAAKELLRREQADAPLPPETYELVGPDVLTGDTISALWSDVLGRPIGYAGNDLEALEQRLKTFGPAWLAYDMRLMMHRYQQDGAIATDAEMAHLTTLLGHAPRSYRAFAEDAVAGWASA
jgi:uncharacterized protein YbjT (DUF2867 family)